MSQMWKWKSIAINLKISFFCKHCLKINNIFSSMATIKCSWLVLKIFWFLQDRYFHTNSVALGFVRLTNIKFSHEFDVYQNVWSKLVFVSPDGLTINYRLWFCKCQRVGHIWRRFHLLNTTYGCIWCVNCTGVHAINKYWCTCVETNKLRTIIEFAWLLRSISWKRKPFC